MKQCCKCNKIKDVSEFYSNKSAPDGLSYACKECTYTRKKKKYISIDEKFLSYVIPTDSTCWGWDGPENYKGRGFFMWKGKKYYIDRYITKSERGRVLYSCNNPQCCNPAHLSIKTVPRKVRAIVNGEQRYNAKLTSDDVLDIRANCIPGDSEHGYLAYGNKYGVSAATVRDVFLRKYWKHID